ncbi:MAG: hypothetical protein HXX17_11195 [Geobacteraceae bacterium]|nr:hypothetical protein [Geobacteraceae bacterium]
MCLDGKYRYIPYILLVAMVLLVYGNSLSGGFVWDDSLFTANQVYWAFDLKKIFLSLANGLEYQPVRDLTYLFDIVVWKGTSVGFHLTNLLLFIAVTLLVYRLAARLCAGFEASRPAWFVPFFTAALFAIHPLKSEVVAWVTQRNTLLATLLFLVATLLFISYQDNGNKKLYFASLAVFVLALLSKATVVVLPLMLLFLMLTGKRQGRWSPLAPFFALSAAGAALHVTIAKKMAVISAAYYGEFSERLSVALQIPFFYLGKFLLPTGISPFYAENFEKSLLSPRTILSALLLAGIVLLLWLLRKQYPELLLGGGWFAITLLPVSNLFATSPVAADRYLFLPSFGLAFALVSMVGRITLPSRVKVSIAALLLALLATVTFRQNRIWHDEISLWSETARRSPQVSGVWFNLGRALHKTPQLSFALEAYLRAIKLDPADIKPLDNAAALFPATRGSIRERHELVMSLAEQMPDYPQGLPQIGTVQREWRHPDAAEELFFYLLSADPDSKHLRLAMASFYRKMGANDRAEAILRR